MKRCLVVQVDILGCVDFVFKGHKPGCEEGSKEIRTRSAGRKKQGENIRSNKRNRARRRKRRVVRNYRGWGREKSKIQKQALLTAMDSSPAVSCLSLKFSSAKLLVP